MNSANEASSPPATAAFLRGLDQLRSGPHYRNYLRARDAVLAILAEDRPDAAPSNYWQAELGGFDYLLDASPLVVEKLREHCHHITGISAYRYRAHHAHEAGDHDRKLAVLRKNDVSDLFVPERPTLGGFGHQVEGGLANLDTLKFYECMIALDRAGFLDGAKADRPETWLEIGGGWGGFGAAAKTRFPKLTYVIVDLPQTLLFSATYLLSAFPEARIALYPELSVAEMAARIDEFDFVLLPHTRFDDIAFAIDLGINMVSFQEMTNAQVAHYLDRLAAMDCRRLYSFNRDESGNNREISKVSALIADHFAPPRQIPILDYSYLTLVPRKGTRPPKKKKKAKGIAGLLGRSAPPPPPKVSVAVAREYRHLVAERTG